MTENYLQWQNVRYLLTDILLYLSKLAQTTNIGSPLLKHYDFLMTLFEKALLAKDTAEFKPKIQQSHGSHVAWQEQ